MIRLTNNQARTIGAVLLSTEIPADLERRILRLYQQGQLANDIYRALQDPDTGAIPLEDVSSVYDALVAARNQERDGTKEVLDIIIEMIKQPFAANMVTTDWLAILRAKLLSKEEENQRLKERDKAFRCGSCGHAFDDDGEEAVIVYDGNAHILHCRACRKPRLTACKTRGCQESVPWFANNKTTFCPACREKLKASKGKLQAAYSISTEDLNPFIGDYIE